MRIANRDVMELCPKCNGTLRLNEELMIWQCTATRCQWRTPAYTIPDKLPEPVPCPHCGSKATGSLAGYALDGREVPANLFGCTSCGDTFTIPVKPEPKLCPTCKRVLLDMLPGRNADPGSYWFCDTCDEYFTDEDFAAPQEAANTKRCKFCDHVLEYDHHVRDDFKWWCSVCNATFNDAGKAQPGQRIWYTVPNEDITITYAFPEPPTVGRKRCMDIERADLLEAVAAAALALFTRNGSELIYMPSGVSRSALHDAVVKLLTAGWRPK